MYGFKFLCDSTFEISHNIWNPYTAKYAFYESLKVWQIMICYDILSLCEMGPWLASLAFPDSKVHGANMAPTWVLSAPYGPHVGPMNLAIRVGTVEWVSSVSGVSLKDMGKRERNTTKNKWYS